jgi:hypothetical protein
MAAGGRLRARFTIPAAGVWEVWLKGEFMPAVTVSVDHKPIGVVAGEVGGDLVVPAISAPLRVRLTAGRHTLTIARGSEGLGPGAGGQSILISAFLAATGTGGEEPLHHVAPGAWRSLCGHRYVWIEAVPTT